MRAQFVFSEVVTGLRRNITMTIAMILTTAISLAMLGVGILMVRTVDLTEQRYLGDLEVAVWLNEDIGRNDNLCNQPVCEGLKKALEAHPGVASVVHENKDEAFKRAQDIFEGEPEMLELMSRDALPASLKVKLKDPERSQVIIQEFEKQPGVARVHDGGQVADRLIGGLNLFRNIAFVGSVVLLLAALLLIANTIQVSAFTRRTEVGIMRLVGATRWYTQLPFLLEAMFAGLIGAILAVAGLLTMQAFIPADFADQMDNVLRFPPTIFTVLVVSPILLLTSMLISTIVGYVTLRLYVRQ